MSPIYLNKRCRIYACCTCFAEQPQESVECAACGRWTPGHPYPLALPLVTRAASSLSQSVAASAARLLAIVGVSLRVGHAPDLVGCQLEGTWASRRGARILSRQIGLNSSNIRWSASIVGWCELPRSCWSSKYAVSCCHFPLLNEVAGEHEKPALKTGSPSVDTTWPRRPAGDEPGADAGPRTAVGLYPPGCDLRGLRSNGRCRLRPTTRRITGCER
jgi:hypothetical protein